MTEPDQGSRPGSAPPRDEPRKGRVDPAPADSAQPDEASPAFPRSEEDPEKPPVEPEATPEEGGPGRSVETARESVATDETRVAEAGAQPSRAEKPTAPPGRRSRLEALVERPAAVIEVPRRRLAAQSRRDFLILLGGVAAAAAGTWWLLPDRARSRLLPSATRERLDTLAARLGLSRHNRERLLDRTLRFDDDIAEALYSKDRRVRTYRRSEVTALPNNYNGLTPGPEYLPTWTLLVSGLASGRVERFTIDRLLGHFLLREQVTRLVCVEGWSAIAWWGGIRFADFLAAFPPAAGARWAAMRSAVNLDGAGQPDPYYVSIDLETARHPQTLLATHQGGRPLTVAHGAPLRLLAPMKLGLKNIKAVTDIAYSASEPADYWNERGYSKYDGL